jgi:DNA-binding response OmpR family regulator
VDAKGVPGADVQRVFEHHGIRIDFSDGVVQRGSARLKLSPTELRLLTALFDARGWVLGHDELMRRVWGHPQQDKGNLKLYVRYLRQKIEVDASNPKLIITRRGLGYMFVVPNSLQTPDNAGKSS